MEPPKKRKFLADQLNHGKGAAIVGQALVNLDPQSILQYSVQQQTALTCSQQAAQQSVSLLDQHNLVNSSEQGEGRDGASSGGTPARRNRRKYSVDFKVSVLNGYYSDPETRYNQRKTAIKYGVNRRQIQKWLAQENFLREQSRGEDSSSLKDGEVGTSPREDKKTKDDEPNSTYKLPYRDEFDRGRKNHSAIIEPETVVKTEPEDFSSGGGRFSDGGGRFLAGGGRFSGPESTAEEEMKPINLSKGASYTDKVKTETEMLSTAAVRRTHPDPISTHILDTSLGVPASNVEVALFRMGRSTAGPGSGDWMKINSKMTNEDGRASAFLSWENFHPGTYKMFFNTGEYFNKSNTTSFYPFAEVVFEIRDSTAHYHIPLLLSPYSYSTYRGS